MCPQDDRADSCGATGHVRHVSFTCLSPRRKCAPMLTWIVPAVSSIMQLGIFFAAAAALVAGMLGVR